MLTGPMVDVEHDSKVLSINILLLAPEIVDKSNFYVMESLSSFKFNLPGVCFTAPRLKF